MIHRRGALLGIALALAFLAACATASTADDRDLAGPMYLPSKHSASLVDITSNEYGAFAGAPDALALGDDAPDFELPTATGGTFSLSRARQDGEVALVFFRGFW